MVDGEKIIDGRKKINRNDVLTDPKKLVRVKLKNAEFGIDTIKIPERIYLLADDFIEGKIIIALLTREMPQ